jgi:hypothetical protein
MNELPAPDPVAPYALEPVPEVDPVLPLVDPVPVVPVEPLPDVLPVMDPVDPVEPEPYELLLPEPLDIVAFISMNPLPVEADVPDAVDPVVPDVPVVPVVPVALEPLPLPFIRQPVTTTVWPLEL